MNVFEFARIVELNRALLREGKSLNVSHPCSSMGNDNGHHPRLTAKLAADGALEEKGPPRNG